MSGLLLSFLLTVVFLCVVSFTKRQAKIFFESRETTDETELKVFIVNASCCSLFLLVTFLLMVYEEVLDYSWQDMQITLSTFSSILIVLMINSCLFAGVFAEVYYGVVFFQFRNFNTSFIKAIIFVGY